MRRKQKWKNSVSTVKMLKRFALLCFFKIIHMTEMEQKKSVWFSGSEQNGFGILLISGSNKM